MKNNDSAIDPIQLDFFEPIAQLVFKKFYITPSIANRKKLFQAVNSRLKSLALNEFSSYTLTLKQLPYEWDELMSLFWASEDYLFKYPNQLDIAKEVIEQWSLMADDRILNVLSIGCGEGHELYSLAIAMEELGLRAKNWDISLYGLDLSKKFIKNAKLGQFKTEDLGWLTERRQKKWFAQKGDNSNFKFKLAPEITFQECNIFVDDFPWPELKNSFHLIFVRNLAWPLTDEGLNKVIDFTKDLMAPDCFIFTAPGELWPLETLKADLEVRNGVLYYKKSLRENFLNRPYRPKTNRKNAIKIFDDKPSQRILNMYYASIELMSDNLELSHEYLVEIIDTEQESGIFPAEAWSLIALTEFLNGHKERALAAIEAILKIKPETFLSHFILVQLHNKGLNSLLAEKSTKFLEESIDDFQKHWSHMLSLEVKQLLENH